MAAYFISDTHFGHGNILKYCCRPFLSDQERQLLAEGRDFKVSRESVERMDAAILTGINAVVGPEDTLWHLGDFSFGPPEAACGYRERIACRTVHLLWGNHDRREIAPLFSQCHEQVGIVVEGQRIFLNHYPMLSWDGSTKGAWHLHGHVHGRLAHRPLTRALVAKLLMLDVGVDGPEEVGSAHTFRPWSMAEIQAYMESKKHVPFNQPGSETC
jgi:calcineurin-like phosphoesterase family protein